MSDATGQITSCFSSVAAFELGFSIILNNEMQVHKQPIYPLIVWISFNELYKTRKYRY